MLDQSKFRYTVTIRPEDCPPEDCFFNEFGRPDYEMCLEIRDRQYRYGDWAWCSVRVECTHEDYPNLSGFDHLGCCSYESFEDFKTGGYWDDMSRTARDEFVEKLKMLLYRAERDGLVDRLAQGAMAALDA